MDESAPLDLTVMRLCTWFAVYSHTDKTIKEIRTASERRRSAHAAARLFEVGEEQGERAAETLCLFYSLAEVAHLQHESLTRLCEGFGLDVTSVTIQQLMGKFEEKLGLK